MHSQVEAWERRKVISQEDIEKYELMKIYDKHHKNKKVYEFDTVAKNFLSMDNR